MSVLLPLSTPPPRSVIQRVHSARQPASRRRAATVGGDDALEYLEASASNQKIVIPAAKADAAILDDANAPPLGAIFRIAQVEQDHAMRNALYLQIVIRLRSIVQHEDRAVASGKELLEREDLPPIAKRIAGKQPQLREGVEYDPRRFDRVHFRQDRSRGVAQFHLGRVKDRIGLVGLEISFRRNDFTDLHACEVPAVRRSHRSQLVFGFGERDVEDRFPVPGAFAQELQRERGLAGARHALDEVQPVGDQPAAQYEVETVDPRTVDRRPVSRFVHLEPPSFVESIAARERRLAPAAPCSIPGIAAENGKSSAMGRRCMSGSRPPCMSGGGLHEPWSGRADEAPGAHAWLVLDARTKRSHSLDRGGDHVLARRPAASDRNVHAST